jgi:type II secretory pathway pseudopilin PulG
MNHRLHKSDDRGFALVELLISFVVIGITTTMVAVCVAGMIQVNNQVILTTDTVNETAKIEALYRDDISAATGLTLNNSVTAPGFTTVTSDLGTGGCRTAVWQFSPQSDPQVVRDLTVSVEVTSATSNSVDGTPYCSGQVLSNQSTVLGTRIFNPVFSFVNLGGRVGYPVIGVTGATLSTLDPSGSPAAGVSTATWNSTTIGAIDLKFSVRAIGDTSGGQTKTADLYQSLGALSTPSNFVPTDFFVFGKTPLN